MTRDDEFTARAVADTLDGKLLPGLELPEYDYLVGLAPDDPRYIEYRAHRQRVWEGLRRGAHTASSDPEATAFLVAAALGDDVL